MLDFATRKRFYNRCRPDEPLEPTDERNVDFDLRGVRGVQWAERLGEAIELSDRPVMELFTGLPGSGKSTELLRLAARLRKEDAANLFVVFINAEESVDLSARVDVVDLLHAIVLLTDEAILREEGKDPNDALREGFIARLIHQVRNTEVEVTKFDAGFQTVGTAPTLEVPIPGVPSVRAGIIAELKARPSLRKRVRDAVTNNFTHFLREVHEELRQQERRVQALGRRGLLIVFDSLEKLRGTSENWGEVLASAEQIFTGGAPYLQLPVHVMYTVPPALVSRRTMERVHFVPMLKLYLRDEVRTPHTPGIDAARELVRRRVPDEVLVECLGPSYERRVGEIIARSGGYPREIVQMLQVVVGSMPHTDFEFRGLLNEFADAHRRAVPAEAYAWLAEVALDRNLVVRDDGHRHIVDLMLSNHAVLRYRNDSEWFDLHPAVREIVGVIRAIDELRRQRAQPPDGSAAGSG